MVTTVPKSFQTGQITQNYEKCYTKWRRFTVVYYNKHSSGAPAMACIRRLATGAVQRCRSRDYLICLWALHCDDNGEMPEHPAI